MDDNGTKVLPMELPQLQFNRVLPKEAEIDLTHFEEAPQNKVPDVYEIGECP